MPPTPRLGRSPPAFASRRVDRPNSRSWARPSRRPWKAFRNIIALLTSLGATFGRIGIEAGPLSQWLVNALTAACLPVICVETRHMKALRNPPRGTVLMLSSSADHFSDLRGHSYERSYDGIWGTGGGFDGTGAATPVERRSEAGDYAWD